jgi:copper transport protein
LGLSHAIRLRRGPAGAVPRRTLGLEAAAATLVLLLAGVLTSAQPATEPQLVQKASPATVPVVDGQADDLQETLTLRPNLPGPSVAVVGTFNTRRPALAPIAAVDVTVLSPDGAAALPVSAERLADGQWSVPVRLTTAGPIHVLVTVERPGMPVAKGTYQWTVGAPKTATKPATVSRAPISGVLRAVSAGLLATLLCAAVLVSWRRRPRRTLGMTLEPSAPTPPQPAAEQIPADVGS